MSAPTIFPAASTYTFGSTSETGIAVETYEQNDQVDHYEQKDNVGQVIEVVTFNARSEITCTGEVNATLAQVLGKNYTFTNLILTQYGGTSTGIAIIRGVQYGRNRARNMTARLTATFYPLVTA
jgi:hypothetical protein